MGRGVAGLLALSLASGCIGGFRLTREYYPDYDLVRRERRVGGTLLAQYPIDKFSRFENSIVLRFAQDHLLRSGDFIDALLLSNFLAFVHDDARGPAPRAASASTSRSATRAT